MSDGAPRWRLALELGLCAVVVAALALNALRRMDYLGADTMAHIRVTDASRTAYVAKNLVEGRGYTASDLPAALVDFYDQRGKLHAEHWPNADRFPFGAYATAALYLATGSTSWVVGILVYNTLFFVAFLVLLYAATSALWRDRYAGMLAVAVALLQPYTYMYLYWKDADSLFLSTLSVVLLVRYYRAAAGEVTRGLAVGLGTVLALVFLSRPNQGAPMLAAVGASILARLWATRRELGAGRALRRHLGSELVIPAVVLLWCLPFMIASLAEWGSPLFSANNLYQLPLGTRYGMGTDTWWKYTEPGQLPTLSLLMDRAGDELVRKLTSSWVATIRHVIDAHALEIVLATGLALWAGRRASPADGRPLRMVVVVFALAVVTNLLVLPLYAYQDFSFRHYLAFGFPLLWMAAGRALAVLGTELRPAARTVLDHLGARAAWYLAGAVVAVVAWNLGAPSHLDRTRGFAHTAERFGEHWVGVVLAVTLLLGRRWILRPPWRPRLALALVALVALYYRPARGHKRYHHAFITSEPAVWTALGARRGVVSSFALQGEVAWNTGRKNIPAPEWPMHVYSFLFDHGLEIEDVYVESAQALVDGIFRDAAPGFEGYARLQRYRTLPGYEVAFHREVMRGYPKFRVEPIAKASTVWRLVDREAVRALRRSPDRIALGDPASAIYLPHGWAELASIDGKAVVAATNVTQARYERGAAAPWEDASITFFLDERRPTAAELVVYVPHRTQLTFYWNLDLYAYDRRADRAAHAIGTHRVEVPGWQRVRLEIPPALLKRGLNKLGFRRDDWARAVLCPRSAPPADCRAALERGVPEDPALAHLAPHIVQVDSLAEPAPAVLALLAHELVLVY
jgi:hypothetical protein